MAAPVLPFPIDGTLKDSSGTLLTSTEIRITNTRTNGTYTINTNSSGTYNDDLANLPDGYLDGDSVTFFAKNPFHDEEVTTTITISGTSKTTNLVLEVIASLPSNVLKGRIRETIPVNLKGKPYQKTNRLPVQAEGPGDIATRHGRKSIYTIDGFAETSTVHMDTGSVAAQTAFMIVDISDTTNWAHSNTDHIIIRHILIEVDPDANYLGEIKVGFLSNVDGTNGDFNQIIDFDMAKKSDLAIEDLTFIGGFHCQASTHFGPKITNSTLFQTDVNLGGPDDPSTGTYPSGNGDLVTLVEVAAGTADVSITLIYETVGEN